MPDAPSDSPPCPAEEIGLRIEPGSENAGYPCTCCGQASQMAYGLVYHDGDAHAVYLAGWSTGHRGEGVRMAVSIGDWSEGATEADRLVVALSCRLEGPEVRFYVVAPSRSPYGNFAYLGAFLSVAEAQAHPHFEAFLDVARQVVRDDRRVRGYLKALSGRR